MVRGCTEGLQDRMKGGHTVLLPTTKPFLVSFFRVLRSKKNGYPLLLYTIKWSKKKVYSQVLFLGHTVEIFSQNLRPLEISFFLHAHISPSSKINVTCWYHRMSFLWSCTTTTWSIRIMLYVPTSKRNYSWTGYAYIIKCSCLLVVLSILPPNTLQ